MMEKIQITCEDISTNKCNHSNQMQIVEFMTTVGAPFLNGNTSLNYKVTGHLADVYTLVNFFLDKQK